MAEHQKALYSDVDNTELGIDDLAFVYDAIKTDLKAKWNDFGLSLGIRYPDLEELEGHKEPLKKVLSLWLTRAYNTKMHPLPSWRSLCMAVHNGARNPAKAQKIASTHLNAGLPVLSPAENTTPQGAEIAESSAPKYFSKKPEMNHLQYMEYMDVPYRVMDKLQPVWKDLATALNFAPERIQVMATKDSKESLYCLLTDWLSGANKERDDSPLTWGTLVKAMKKANIQAVADFLTKHLDEMLNKQ